MARLFLMAAFLASFRDLFCFSLLLYWALPAAGLGWLANHSETSIFSSNAHHAITSCVIIIGGLKWWYVWQFLCTTPFL